MVARKPTVSISAQAPKKKRRVKRAKGRTPRDALNALVELPKYRDLFRSCPFDPRSKKHAQLVLDLYQRTQPNRNSKCKEPILLNGEYWKLRIETNGLLQIQPSTKASVKTANKSPAAKPKKRPAPVEQGDNSVIVIDDAEPAAQQTPAPTPSPTPPPKKQKNKPPPVASAPSPPPQLVVAPTEATSPPAPTAAPPQRVDDSSEEDDSDTDSAPVDGPPAPEGADGGADHDDQASSDSDDGPQEKSPDAAPCLNWDQFHSQLGVSLKSDGSGLSFLPQAEASPVAQLILHLNCLKSSDRNSINFTSGHVVTAVGEVLRLISECGYDWSPEMQQKLGTTLNSSANVEYALRYAAMAFNHLVREVLLYLAPGIAPLDLLATVESTKRGAKFRDSYDQIGLLHELALIFSRFPTKMQKPGGLGAVHCELRRLRESPPPPTSAASLSSVGTPAANPEMRKAPAQAPARVETSPPI